MKNKMEKRDTRDNNKDNTPKRQKVNYVRIGQIGRGGFAEVFLEQKNDKQRVAKVLYNVSEASKTDVKSEVELLSGLTHPNIIRYLGCSLEKQKVIYFEYAELGSLHHFIENHDHMDWKAFGYKCAYQISCALTYLHGKKIVHRDVKPDNILLMTDYTAKLCDFGYAGQLSKIDRREFLGTALFMAPEIINGKKYDYKVDCYAFGITLFEMSTMGETWPDKSNKEIYEAVLQGKVQALAKDTPKLVQDVYQGCTLFSPKKRLAAKDISAQFATILDDGHGCNT